MLDINDMIGKIYCGDCLEVMKQMPDKCVDLVLTDPPYGINYQSNMRVVSNKFDMIKNDDTMEHTPFFLEYYRILKDNSVAIICCSWKNYHEDFAQLQNLFDIKNVIVWSKGGGGIGDLTHSLLTDYELMIIAHKGQCTIRGKREGSVWNINKVNPAEMVHPTEKPVELMGKFISIFTDKDGIVIDTFLGSGTTAVAAERLGRRWIGIEMEPKYCAIAQARVDTERNQLKLPGMI